MTITTHGVRMLTVAAVAILWLMTAGCGAGSASPTAPAGTAIDRDAARVVSIAIEPNRGARVTDRTVAFVATARFSDGSKQDVTADAQWRSSNPRVTIVDAGLVRWLDSGEATLTAAYRGAVGELHVAMTIFADAAAVAASGR